MATDVEPARRCGCPKRMVYGPCGGVRPDGSCEVDGALPCAFVDSALVPWSGPLGGRKEGPLGDQTGLPVVVTDFHVRPRDSVSVRDVGGALAGSCDFVLVGDHGGTRNDYPPAVMAARALEAGVRPWVTLSCRDRNRVALAAELAALADLGVTGVHCVTGDWQGLSGGVGETKVFDLDALRLVALAVEAGLTVSVAASPASPPFELRARRLAAKAKAGASVCFVNHCGGAQQVGRFVDQALAAGAPLAYLPCVPVVSDPLSRIALARLPGLRLDTDVLDEVERGGNSPAAGIDAAHAEARRMLRIAGVVGVNLSGAASTRSETVSATMMAELGRRLLDPLAATVTGDDGHAHQRGADA